MRDLALGGDGVVETDGGLVLVAGVLPGERVAIADIKREGRVQRGSLARIVEASPLRVRPSCAIVDRCGGCPWMAFDVASQRDRKRRFVEDAVGIPVAPMTAGDGALGYRRRARLAFERHRGAMRIGYRARRSRDLADVDACVVLDPALDRALAQVRGQLATHLAGSGEIALAIGSGGKAVVGVRTGDPQPPALYRACESLLGADIIGALLRGTWTGAADARFGDPRAVTTTIDGDELTSDPFGFAQANDEVNRALAAAVIELAQPEGAKILELYAGHGNLTLPLARRAAEVTVVELDPAAAKACEANLRAAGLTAKVRTGDSATHAAGTRVDVVVLDPPREGAKGTIPAIAARKPERIVYVSCDPATLGRDLAALRTLGFAPDEARAFDMFPQTAHVEAVVRCVRG